MTPHLKCPCYLASKHWVPVGLIIGNLKYIFSSLFILFLPFQESHLCCGRLATWPEDSCEAELEDCLTYIVGLVAAAHNLLLVHTLSDNTKLPNYLLLVWTCCYSSLVILP